MRVRLAIWFLLMSGIVGLAQVSPLHVPVTGPIFGGSSVPFVGFGDLVPAGLRFYWGFRAMSLAAAGGKAANICNVSDVACADMSTNGNGDFVVTTVGGSDCSMVTCTVKTLYNQGSWPCTTNNCDMTQPTIANRPVLIPNCLNGHPCMSCLASSSQQMDSGNIGTAIAAPNSFASTVIRTSAFTTAGSWFGVSGNFGDSLSLNYDAAVNQVQLYGGATVTKSGIADNAWHAIQNVLNGASSSISADGSTTTGSAGTAFMTRDLLLCNDGFGILLNGRIAEVAGWGIIAFAAGDITALNANQHAYWGF